MIFRTSEQEIKQYEQSSAINQSLLKKLLGEGIHAFIKERNLSDEEKDKNNKKEHFLIGHAVDCIITYGVETFQKKYFISQLAKKPSETIMNIIKQVFDEAQQAFEKLGSMELSAPALNVLLNEAIIIFEYQKNWKPEIKLAKVIEQGSDYWEDLKQSLGKIILSDTQATNILTIANNMLNHKHTAGLFKDSADIDIIYQQPLYFKYLETDCKALPDVIRINHKTKKIYPLDCKTTFDSILNFKFALKSYRY